MLSVECFGPLQHLAFSHQPFYGPLLDLELSTAAETALPGVKDLHFKKPPELTLRWSDSGNSVAVYLNGNPWAFVDEKSNKSYSKGILNTALFGHWIASGGSPWDQIAFENSYVNAS